MTDYARIYAKQEYLTPAAAETVELIAEAVNPGESAFLLDVAAGKGEAACTLAGRFACRILAVDVYDPFIQDAAAKASRRNLHHLVTVLRGDGGRLPVRHAIFDAAYCIGGPSIVGPEPCLAELARAVKPGGHVIVSDIAWRRKPDGELGPEWGEVAEISPRLSRDEYTALIAAQGLAVSRVHIHERSAWGEYFSPMADVAREARASGDPDDLALAQEIERDIAVEGRAADAFLDYATFLARRPD